MDYLEFRDVVQSYVLVPTEEQKKRLIEAEDSIHFAVVIKGDNKDFLAEEFDTFVETITVVKERGAVLGIDFIITGSSFIKDHPEYGFVIALHCLCELLSDEDFPTHYQRYK